MRGVDNRQQFMLEEFYKREKIWGADNYLCGFAAGIVLVIAAILLIMPVQVWEGDYGMIGYCLLLELMGMGLYIRQYCMFREDGKNKSVHEILCFAPVSYWQFVLYMLKRLFRLCLCMTGVAMSCQVVFALAVLDTFSVWNLLMPLLCCLVLPMLFWGAGSSLHVSDTMIKYEE